MKCRNGSILKCLCTLADSFKYTSKSTFWFKVKKVNNIYIYIFFFFFLKNPD